MTYPPRARPVLEACASAGIKVHVAGVYMGLHHTNAGSAPISGTDDEIYAGAKRGSAGRGGQGHF